MEKNFFGFDLRACARERVIITAHRGTFGANIPCNTLTSYEIALRQGADMIEIDVDRTSDGQLVIFHPGKERQQLGIHDKRIKDMTLAEIRENVRYLNYDRDATEMTLNTLEEVFDRFRGRCFINVDKFWENPREITDMIRAFGMEGQIVVKTEPSKPMFDLIEEYAPEIQYLPIIRDPSCHSELLSRRINYVGAEVLFEREDSPLCQPAYIDEMHRDGKLVWVNAIVYWYKAVLAAHHSDDTAMGGDPERGWGWLVDRGFDIIQTDWTRELDLYLVETGRRFRK